MVKNERELQNRNLYLNKLIAFQDTEPVKIITGIRRCGKSSLLKLMARYLRNNGIVQEQIIELDFESMDLRKMNAEALYQYVWLVFLTENALTCFLMKFNAWISGKMR